MLSSIPPLPIFHPASSSCPGGGGQGIPSCSIQALHRARLSQGQCNSRQALPLCPVPRARVALKPAFPPLLGHLGTAAVAAHGVGQGGKGRGENLPLSMEGKERGRKDSYLLEGLKKMSPVAAPVVLCPPWCVCGGRLGPKVKSPLQCRLQLPHSPLINSGSAHGMLCSVLGWIIPSADSIFMEFSCKVLANICETYFHFSKAYNVAKFEQLFMVTATGTGVTQKPCCCKVQALPPTHLVLEFLSEEITRIL